MTATCELNKANNNRHVNVDKERLVRQNPTQILQQTRNAKNKRNDLIPRKKSTHIVNLITTDWP